jgi:hypothetical protein
MGRVGGAKWAGPGGFPGGGREKKKGKNKRGEGGPEAGPICMAAQATVGPCITRGTSSSPRARIHERTKKQRWAGTHRRVALVDDKSPASGGALGLCRGGLGVVQGRVQPGSSSSSRLLFRRRSRTDDEGGGLRRTWAAKKGG